MKKFNSFKSKWLLVPLVLFTLCAGNAWGANVVLTLNDNSTDTWTNQGASGGGTAIEMYDKSVTGITLSGTSGYCNTSNKYTQIYASSTTTIESEVGNITKIVFNGKYNKTSGKFTDTNGAYQSFTSTNSNKTFTYASGVSSMAFTADKQILLQSATVYYAVATTSTASITGLDYTAGSGPSTAQSFTVSGTDLGGTLTVSAPTNFEVSKTSSTSGFASSVTLTPSSGTVSSTTIYVRLASGKSAGTYGGASTYVTVTGGGINTKNVSVSGTVSAAASCSANVEIGTASLNGTFNLSTVGVQCASITPGSNCAVAANNYGFIWYQGTGDKVIGGDGVTRVNNTTAYSSGTFSNSLTSTFVAGTTYTFRAFAINDKPSTAYSAAVSFTPYTVTFNMNGHGSAPSQQVVNTGGTASTPSAPSATGYTFGGWYQEAGCTNAVNWSSTITANKDYYAKWTAKEYTVTLDNESPTVSGSTSVTLTYNSASHAAITNPTKTGYTFAGWWTADNGTGTEVINTSGVLQANVSNYTGAGGIWTRDNNSTTLYAKWTAKSFTVTWMVNGEEYTTGSPSEEVDFGTHVTTLPTAPTPPCGNKFMGWTTTNIGSVGLDKDDDAAAITALNLFTTAGSAPTISAEGNVTYYAVFADYAE